MGVLACNREGCENIMCDRYSRRYGYICNECFEELSRADWIDIESFMETPKDTNNTDMWLDFIDEEFRTR